MAEIVLGVGTSHGPMLSMPPELWAEFGADDHKREALVAPWDGSTVSYDELLAHADPAIAKELTLEKFQRRHAEAQKAIATLGETLREARPDTVVIISNDQQEFFYDDLMPCFTVYWGESIPLNARNAVLSGGTSYRTASAWGYGDVSMDVPVDPRLGKHLIDFLIADGFDIAHFRYVRPEYGGSIGPAGYITAPLEAATRKQGLPHGFAFVIKRLMDNQPVPIVPFFQNTFYPPNQPTTRRCYAMGQALRRAIEAWDADRRVAIVASGGFSHFVIDPEVDELAHQGFRERDPEILFSLPEWKLQSGTSEIKDWITLAGACEPLDYHFVGRTPGYRSPAGTGHADGFAFWR
jgi:3-O-methylgallate 3,4-dioxygenase